MRYLSANYLFPLHIDPIEEGVLQISDEGEIIDIFVNRSEVPQDKLEIFEGVLCPGFVNVHCHLELSHLLGELPQQTGLPEFISHIPQKRGAELFIIEEAMKKADTMMKKNGIVGVGDISNTSDSFQIKQKSKIQYYTFLEIISLDDKKAETVFHSGLELLEQCEPSVSLVPHATYSVSERLFSLLKSYNSGEVICIHNQETKTEDELFESGSGDLFERLKQFGTIPVSGKSALQTTLPKMPKQSPIVLVHNTYTSKKDIDWAASYNNQIYWCTCPKANLYIENILPDYSMFDSDKLCVGTDSLASNDSLSILEELQIIQENSHFEMNTLLKIASKNGAEALGFEKLGTFEKGKVPGVNLIIDFNKLKVIL